MRLLPGRGTRAALLATLFLAGAASSRGQDQKSEAAFPEGVRTVVLVGNGLVEESQTSGYIETRLTRRFPDRRLVFRNLGWTGDTVWGRARTSGYQNPSGLERLKKQVSELKPDLLIVGYGLTESFEGPAGLEKFGEGYRKLLDLLSAITPRLVLLSPAPHEDLGRPYPDPKDHNASLERYGAAIRSAAEQRHLPFVDLYHPLTPPPGTPPGARLTSNGILLGDVGYWEVAFEIERQLGLSRPPWRAELGTGGEVKSAAGVAITELGRTADKLEWKALEDELPAPLPPAALRTGAAPAGAVPVLAVAGLKDGDWTLRVNGEEVASAAAGEWARGVPLARGPSFDQVEALRAAISKRNNLFTRRWRPINDWPAHYTYIAPDYALYDGLVAKEDDRVAALSKPGVQSYELSPKRP